MNGKAPTIKNLAKMLNLSVSTVSRSLHDSESISPETTKRVKDLASAVGYEPNRTAVFLQSGRTLTIGVILPQLSESFFFKAISGIEDYALENNYNVLMGQSYDDTEREKKIVETMKNHRVDGIWYQSPRIPMILNILIFLQNITYRLSFLTVCRRE